MITNIKYQKADEYSERHGFPLFSIFEVNISPYCTRRCSFCPRGHGYIDSGRPLSLDSAIKMTGELSEIKFSGLLVISGLCEPMTHPYWSEIREIFTSGPWLSQVVTNGDLLVSPDQISGFDYVCVSLCEGPRPELELMLSNRGGVYDIHRRYENDFIALSNRAGYLEGVAQPERPCNYPLYHMFVNHDGRAFTCCHDWWGKYDLGNVFEDGIMHVWLSEKYHNHRKVMLKNRNIAHCVSCDANGMLSGGNHRQGWSGIYKESTNGHKGQEEETCQASPQASQEKENA
jgi:radical SAM protein with 4Fe4S-binding SPASM domain